MLTETEAYRCQRREDTQAYARRWFAAREPLERQRREQEHQRWCWALARCLRRCV